MLNNSEINATLTVRMNNSIKQNYSQIVNLLQLKNKFDNDKIFLSILYI